MAPNLFQPTYITLALLLVCFAVTMFLARKFQREVAEDSAPTTPGELYGPLEKAYYAGLMREDEYLRIRAQRDRDQKTKAAPVAAAKAKPAGPADEWASWDAPGA